MDAHVEQNCSHVQSSGHSTMKRASTPMFLHANDASFKRCSKPETRLKRDMQRDMAGSPAGAQQIAPEIQIAIPSGKPT